ncbi:hypothetical protein KFE25_003888 [Diacronema lutheri]|uniref:CP-type G domain-containing protein n=2 Tax=Diacronema lutheri TaxID=2081491 RepID=A0A8J5XQH1_DIALT|nr:hypothetical protein KFE25_003888 [Diacronema lutheri]
MGMKNKQKRAGVKRERLGMVNLREEKLARVKAQNINSRAAKVAAARGMDAPAPLVALSKSAARRQKYFARQERAAPAASAAAEERGDDPAAALVANAGRQRAFHKELDRVVAMSDVLLEVLDARDPLGCRCAALETAALEHRTPKRIVIVLNKADLVPPDNLDAWVRYLRRFHPTIAFKATDLGARRRAPAPAQPQLTPSAVLRDDPASTLPAGPSRPLGAPHTVDDLIQLLKSYSRSDKLLTAITVGVVGYPNVGKSSVINALKRAKAVTTGAMPGVTRALQVVALDRKIKLVDCPGVVFSKPRSAADAADMVLRSVLKVDTAVEPSDLAEALLRKCTHETIRRHFALGEFDSASDLLALVALKRGLLRKGGTVDLALAARVLAQEWTSGAIAFHSEPPRADETVDEGAAIVGTLAPAFDVERVAHPTVERARAGAAKRAREPRSERDGDGDGADGAPSASDGGSDGGDDDDDPSELAGTMDDDVAQRALLAALRAGSRKRAPRSEDEPTDPNLARKAPLARKKVPTEYVVPLTQKQQQKKRLKEQARGLELSQRALGLADEQIADISNVS